MNQITLDFGNVTAKRISTPNDFVSHMLEHIAWRMGLSIDLNWDNRDWTALGTALGGRIASFAPKARAGAAMGMLDDGSAEALVDLDGDAGLEMTAALGVDLDWFVSLRCEQLDSGFALQDLLTGLAKGLEAGIRVRVCTLEDPHHTWEGVFRAVGVALCRIFTPDAPQVKFSPELSQVRDKGPIQVVARSSTMARIRRDTAESGLSVLVDFEKSAPVSVEYSGPEMTHLGKKQAADGLGGLVGMLAQGAGFSCQVAFSSKVLSSSHVLLEDTGMGLGRALREVLVCRMMDTGINGAGSSMVLPADYDRQDIRVCVSVEGRKFFRFVPLNHTYDALRRGLLLGHTVMGGLFSEDLDDFMDGLSWGLGCSIVIHVKKIPPPQQAWPMIFTHLGKALAEVFAPNPYRKGVPPGVKANLA